MYNRVFKKQGTPRDIHFRGSLENKQLFNGEKHYKSVFFKLTYNIKLTNEKQYIYNNSPYHF